MYQCSFTFNQDYIMHSFAYSEKVYWVLAWPLFLVPSVVSFVDVWNCRGQRQSVRGDLAVWISRPM